MKATTITALFLLAALAVGPATAGPGLQFDGLRVVGNLPGSGPGSDLIEAWGLDQECSDKSNINGDMNCDDWNCLVGDTVAVSASTDDGGYVWGDAQCGFASAYCSNAGSCEDRSQDPATQVDQGECDGHNSKGLGARIVCGAGAATATWEVMELLSRSNSSPDVLGALESSGLTSVIVKEVLPDGSLVTVFQWNNPALG